MLPPSGQHDHNANTKSSSENNRGDSSTRTFVYRGNLPVWLALLLAAPLLLFAFSLVAALLVGGALATFVLPMFLRRSLRPRRDAESIELDATDYHRVDEAGPRLPEPPA